MQSCGAVFTKCSQLRAKDCILTLDNLHTYGYTIRRNNLIVIRNPQNSCLDPGSNGWGPSFCYHTSKAKKLYEISPTNTLPNLL